MSNDFETIITAADVMLLKLISESFNKDFDDIDSYWPEETTWCNRYLYYRDELNNKVLLERLCATYSTKLPNLEFYYIEDTSVDEPVSEIGYTISGYMITKLN